MLQISMEKFASAGARGVRFGSDELDCLYIKREEAKQAVE